MRTRTKYGGTAGAATFGLVVLRRHVPRPLWWLALTAAVIGLAGWAWRYISSPT